MTVTQDRARAVQASGTVRVDAIRTLAESWMASSHRGSTQWECGVSLIGLLAAATEPTPSVPVLGGGQL